MSRSVFPPQRELSITHTGAINFGDVIMLLNAGSKVLNEERLPTVLSLNFDLDMKIKTGCEVVSSTITKPTYRTAFTVTRSDPLLSIKLDLSCNSALLDNFA